MCVYIQKYVKSRHITDEVNTSSTFISVAYSFSVISPFLWKVVPPLYWYKTMPRDFIRMALRKETSFLRAYDIQGGTSICDRQESKGRCGQVPKIRRKCAKPNQSCVFVSHQLDHVHHRLLGSFITRIQHVPRAGGLAHVLLTSPKYRFDSLEVLLNVVAPSLMSCPLSLFFFLWNPKFDGKQSDPENTWRKTWS